MPRIALINSSSTRQPEFSFSGIVRGWSALSSRCPPYNLLSRICSVPSVPASSRQVPAFAAVPRSGEDRPLARQIQICSPGRPRCACLHCAGLP